MPHNKHTKHRVALIVSCSDFRLHDEAVHIIDQARRLLGARAAADIIVRPGPDGILIDPKQRELHAKSLIAEVKLLVGAHGIADILVLSHGDCKGHPVSDEQHEEDALLTAKRLKQETGIKGDAIAAIATRVNENDKKWMVRRVGTA
jgi:carbonic anhydrase